MLAIVIPTYNRSEILRDNILKMLPEIKEFSIPIFISDDSTDCDTKKIIQELNVIYKNIFYYKNNPSLGHDHNIFQTLRLPKNDYVWLLGDSVLIKKGSLAKILKIIQDTKADIISVNAENRMIDIDSQYFSDCNEVFNKLAWHLTLTGCTIYSRSSVSTIDSLKKNKCVNFPQISLIFSHLASHCSFYWVNQKFVYAHIKKESYWVNSVFRVFLNDWSSVIQSLPSCYHNKRKVILMHSSILGIFSFKNMILHRARGAYNINVFKKYKLDLLEHSDLSVFTLLMILIMPKVILKSIVNLRQLLKLKRS